MTFGGEAPTRVIDRRGSRPEAVSVQPVVSLSCPVCGDAADVPVGDWWTCGCGCSVCAEAPGEIEDALSAIARGHRVRLLVGLAAVAVAAALPGLLLDRGALVLAPVAAAGLFVGLVLPVARHRREVAIARVPDWHATA